MTVHECEHGLEGLWNSTETLRQDSKSLGSGISGIQRRSANHYNITQCYITYVVATVSLK
jgi:hypothetical protein